MINVVNNKEWLKFDFFKLHPYVSKSFSKSKYYSSGHIIKPEILLPAICTLHHVPYKTGA
jgi:hypothetical protein